MNGFSDRLAAQIRAKSTPVLVGLDPRWKNLPSVLRPESQSPQELADAYQQFCCEVIDVVAPLVAAVKPQMAFFEQLGPAGMNALAEVLQHARRRSLLVILDGKRNDIGSTATAYADAYLGEQSAWQADALTVSPYLGADSIQPFVDVCQDRGAGLFVLVKTSNPGGGLFQDLTADGQPIYGHVARFVHELSTETRGECGYGNIGAVVGATYPEHLQQLREAMPNCWFLVPGFGAQGGDASSVRAAFDKQGLGAIINSSRAIIFAYEREPYQHLAGSRWQTAVEAATCDMIQQLAD